MKMEKTKTYEIIYTVTGRASATVTASSLEEAEELAANCDIDADSDRLIEWSYDEVESVEVCE